MIGENTAGKSTLLTTALNLMADTPAATQVAPMKPPNSACEELEGRSQQPRNQVPQDGADQTTEDHHWGDLRLLTSPLEMVLATWIDKNAPTKLSIRPARPRPGDAARQWRWTLPSC